MRLDNDPPLPPLVNSTPGNREKRYVKHTELLVEWTNEIVTDEIVAPLQCSRVVFSRFSKFSFFYFNKFLLL